MSIWALIEGIIGIIRKLVDVFPDWWKKHQAKNKAKLEEQIHDLKIERLALRKRLKDATMEEREKLMEEYFALNKRIRYLESLLRED